MPRTRLILAAALTFGTSTALAQKELKLTDYRSEKGGFLVKMPGTPKVDTKDLDTGTGGKPVRVTTARVETAGHVVFAASYADYPESYRDVEPKTILNGVRDGLKGTDGKLDGEEKDLSLEAGGEKYPGREVVIKAGRNYVRARVYLVGTRLYQVMVTGSKEAVTADSADKFLYSFQLLK